jgi:hypothetical protein
MALVTPIDPETDSFCNYCEEYVKKSAVQTQEAVFIEHDACETWWTKEEVEQWNYQTVQVCPSCGHSGDIEDAVEAWICDECGCSWGDFAEAKECCP